MSGQKEETQRRKESGQKKEIYDARKDPMFARPRIDAEERQTRKVEGQSEPVPCRYFHGYFEGTSVKFSFWFPEKDAWEGRFFQHLSPFPGPDEEMASAGKMGEDDFIAFALTHGAAYAESNMGSDQIFGSQQDPSIFYRSSAAVAEYCRTAAAELYGEKDRRVYGYVFGGSGGGYKTMSCIENTCAFDGAVPYVIGSPVSLPNCLTVCANAARRLRHVCVQISEALEPGGSGDIYRGLDGEEKKALRELVRMGFPPRLCSTLAGGDDGALPVLMPTVRMMDPEYFTDFWTKSGYEGTDPEGSARRDRIHLRTTVVKAGLAEKTSVAAGKENAADDRNGTDDAWKKMMGDAGAMALEVLEVPEGEDLYLRGVDIVFESGLAKGRKLRLAGIDQNRLIPGMSYGCDNIEDLIGLIRPGDQILLDNSDYIAVSYYHTHQVPEDLSFHAWDQYRDSDGKPLLPQRPVMISYPFTLGGCGSVQDGRIQGKVILMNNLMDGDWPWQADWYRNKVGEVYGDEARNLFRLWYNDNCPHGDASEVGDNLHIVSYLGMLRQALCDVARWAETGEAPVASTGYHLTDNQVIPDEDPAGRGGIQPVVRLRARIGENVPAACVRVKPGEAVTFLAEAVMPEGAGDFGTAAFSFEGEQDFPYRDFRILEKEDRSGRPDGTSRVLLETSHVFEKPGRYYGVVRVISNRNGGDPYTRLRNLDRVCVIVE